MDSKSLELFSGSVGFVKGRHCTILGSAPSRILPSNYSNTLLITINGSGIGISRNPDLTLIGARICLAKSKTCRFTIRNLNGKYSERVLFVHPGDLEDYQERYRDFGFECGGSQTMTANQRFELVKTLTGYELPGLSGSSAPSNGVLGALLVAAAGASIIDLSGFSLSPGHFYIIGDTVRNHIKHDEVLLQWISENYFVRSNDIEMCKRFGFHEINN
jgi:hypothetical protein